jgi:hypothetical protein
MDSEHSIALGSLLCMLLFQNKSLNRDLAKRSVSEFFYNTSQELQFLALPSRLKNELLHEISRYVKTSRELQI